MEAATEERARKVLIAAPREQQGGEFEQFIRNVERTTSDIVLSKKRNILLRKKQKENQLIRSRIIPPALSVSRVVMQESRSAQLLKPTTAYTSMSSVRLTTTPGIETRELCRTAHDGGREKKGLQRQWRLLHRRDELNVLKFPGQRSRDKLETVGELTTPPSMCKVFKVRRKFTKTSGGAGLSPKRQEEDFMSRLGG